MAKLLIGAEVTAAMNEKLIADVKELKDRGVSPSLAIVRLGEKGEDVIYERGVIKRCEKIGVGVRSYVLPLDIAQDKLLGVIAEINQDITVHGCLLFRPLPRQFDEEIIRQALTPAKDIDGITNDSLAGVFAGTKFGFPPCTAQAVIEILDFYGYDLQGKKAVVIGRSLVIGKPVSMMLLAKNATVSICHTRTLNLPAVCREAEILIVAAGRAETVDRTFLAPGQIVIDVGINVNKEGKLCGDVKFSDAESMVAAITPVPGGVGTVTISVLIKHVVEAAKSNLAIAFGVG